MSRKFRWFLLGACAFVALMAGGEALSLLAAGPQGLRAPSELVRSPHATPERATSPRSAAPRTLPFDAQLARGESRQP
jgi:hypothetical protein